jgi:hypothetical protein
MKKIIEEISFSDKKREKFVYIAQKRVNSALKSISLIGNLANKNNYKYEDQDIRKILKALNEEINNLKNRFQTGNSDDKIFKL